MGILKFASVLAYSICSCALIPHDGDGNPQISEYENYNANLHLEFRPSEKTTEVTLIETSPSICTKFYINGELFCRIVQQH